MWTTELSIEKTSKDGGLLQAKNGLANRKHLHVYQKFLPFTQKEVALSTAPIIVHGDIFP